MAYAARSTLRPAAGAARPGPDVSRHARRPKARTLHSGPRHERPSRRDLAAGPVLLLLAGALWAVTVADTTGRVSAASSTSSRVAGVGAMVVVTFLMASSVLYLVARQGALLRFRDHRWASRAELDERFDGSSASVTALVPSYAEEAAVVRATLWSAALQEFPRVRVVLLIDDAPEPADPAARTRLEETRALAAEIESALAGPNARHRGALGDFSRRRGAVTDDDVLAMALEYEAAAKWVESLAAERVVGDHVDRFFSERLLGGLARELRGTVDSEAETVGLQAQTCPPRGFYALGPIAKSPSSDQSPRPLTTGENGDGDLALPNVEQPRLLDCFVCVHHVASGPSVI